MRPGVFVFDSRLDANSEAGDADDVAEADGGSYTGFFGGTAGTAASKMATKVPDGGKLDEERRFRLKKTVECFFNAANDNERQERVDANIGEFGCIRQVFDRDPTLF
jgi:hypothetical protein